MITIETKVDRLNFLLEHFKEQNKTKENWIRNFYSMMFTIYGRK